MHDLVYAFCLSLVFGRGTRESSTTLLYRPCVGPSQKPTASIFLWADRYSARN